MKTKYIAVRGVLSLLSAAAAFSLASCGNAGNENTTACSEATAVEEVTTEEAIEIPDCPYEEMSVPQLQQVILGKLAANGPVTDQMKREVSANIWKDSLLNWAKSFR